MQFRDRRDAGRILAGRLTSYVGRGDVLVLALPRGGVPVGYEVATALGAPLDVFLVRKLGAPGQPELAMGAIASGGIRVLNADVIEALGIPPHVIEVVTRAARAELERHELTYRGRRQAPVLADRTVILVDDGLATGSTMRAAVAAARQQSPSRVVVAVPVAAMSTCDALRGDVDDIVCALTPAWFSAVGFWYEDFSQTSDEEVRDLLDRGPLSPPGR